MFALTDVAQLRQAATTKQDSKHAKQCPGHLIRSPKRISTVFCQRASFSADIGNKLFADYSQQLPVRGSGPSFGAYRKLSAMAVTGSGQLPA